MILKFRVWDKVNECYCYINNLQFVNLSTFVEGEHWKKGKLISHSTDYCKHPKRQGPIMDKKNYVIEQSTGKLDIDGHEIWISLGEQI